ncbi:MFS transporter [Hydrogenovibrio marinus]|uniref:MFS transporter n=1 Tax=Hydrogenovibrio marinus TaxID=28885 RepID=A0A066ZRE9_HYDMR|nr:MFS transporter [Hydrogenovibrio marinus]KDN96072.1 MFS transporter [Hydrogenovibrio marinus]BBN58431.1 MFS transporter [Hydrogenovibrio marinus]
MNTADSQQLNRLYDLIHGDEDTRACKDIPESACHDQPRNFFAYLTANSLGKIADELASAKLILPWLLGMLGAPAIFAGFLVPIREACVLLPQLMVAALVRNLPVRKGVWLLGAALSALALFGMAITAFYASGAMAGWAIIIALLVFSLARGLCSVSAKDVLGKTISKGKRGVLMGYSASFAGVITLGIGAIIEMLGENKGGNSQLLLASLLALGAVLWVVAYFSFNRIIEQPGATEGGKNALAAAIESFSLLKTDAPFRQYVIARTLFLSTALVPPFYVLVAQSYSEGALSGLGMLIIAGGLASSLSAPIWGKMSDKSSRKVMITAAGLSGLLGILLFAMVEEQSSWLTHPITHAGFFMAITLFHSGIRLGRKVYLVDLSNGENRAMYVALSNTLIGIFMLLAGGVGLLADIWSVQSVILLLSVIAIIGALWTWRLPEVSLTKN